MKHRSIRALFAALAVFLLGFGTVFDVSAASEFASGNGTASDPYVIETAAQLAYLSESVNGSGTYRSSHFVLVNDITLNDESFTFNSDTGLVRVSDGTNTAYLGTGIKGDNSKGNTVFDTVASEAGVWYKSDSSKTVGAYAGDLNSWTPIGNESKRFDGCFDGKGHTVSGLYVNIQGANGGLFGYASAELDNVRIKNSYVHAGELAGTVAGCNLYKTVGCISDAVVCSKGDNVGGVIGMGGSVSGSMSLGISAGRQNVGGVAGSAKAEGCCSVGQVFGDTSVGGIMGSGRGFDNLSSADVFGTQSVGGICGNAITSVATSYNCGTVMGEKYVGSVIGRLSEVSVVNCYYLANCAFDTSGKAQNGFGTSETGKSRTDTAGMTTALDSAGASNKASFKGFDFEKVWTILGDGSLSLISFQKELHTHVYENACDGTCDLCGETRSVTHTYKTAWSSSSEKHWRECSVCLSKADESTHSAGAPATESSPQVCTVCSYVIAPALGHTHNYSNAWTYDDNSHWHACGCGDKGELSSHSYENSCDTTCSICAYVRSVAHQYQDVWSMDQNSHWYKCSVCSAKTNVSDHRYDGTCDNDCNDCGYKRTAYHKYETEWSTDLTSHWHECEYCSQKTDIQNHGYDNSCDTVCNACGYERSADHTYKTTVSKDDKSHWYECIVCFAKKDAEPHTYDNACDPVCDACGYEREASHTFDENWLSDGDQHWKECIVCHEKKDEGAHEGKAAATETSPQVCKVCAYVMAPALGHTHNYSNAWRYDSTSHWYVCECGSRDKLSDHRYDNACDKVCNDCSYVRSVTHSYQTTWSTDESGHWYDCSVCGSKKDKASHKPGAAATQSAPQTCTVCSYVIAPAIGHTHSYNSEWKSDGVSHWHECSCGDKKDVEAHKYDNGCDSACNVCARKRSVEHAYAEIAKYDNRSHWIECSVCHDKKPSELHFFDNMCDTVCNGCPYERKITHVLDGKWSSNEQEHWHKCTLCGAECEKTAHSWDGGTVTKEPTVNEEGARTYKCTKCQFTKNESIDKTTGVTTDEVTTTPDTTGGTSVETTTGSAQTETNDMTIANKTPQKPSDKADSDKDESGLDGYLVLTVVLGVISVILLVVLIVMMLYVLKKKNK